MTISKNIYLNFLNGFRMLKWYEGSKTIGGIVNLFVLVNGTISVFTLYLTIRRNS